MEWKLPLLISCMSCFQTRFVLSTIHFYGFTTVEAILYLYCRHLASSWNGICVLCLRMILMFVVILSVSVIHELQADCNSVARNVPHTLHEPQCSPIVQYIAQTQPLVIWTAHSRTVCNYWKFELGDWHASEGNGCKPLKWRRSLQFTDQWSALDLRYSVVLKGLYFSDTLTHN
jgi:hypothetical protein